MMSSYGTRPHTPKFFSNLQQNQQAEDFITRNTSRTISYVNHVCAFEDILRRLYDETIRALQGLDASIVVDQVALATRKKEMDDCFTFRNKVSAHTAYGVPRPKDNAAMELHSLVALLSSSFDTSRSADSFALGLSSVQLAGQSPSTTLPCIGLKALHPAMVKHVEQWTKMLTEPCAAVRKNLPQVVNGFEYQAS